MPKLVTNCGPVEGPLLYRDLPGIAISVVEAPPLGNWPRGFLVGIAYCQGADSRGRAVYALQVRKQSLPGRWIVESRAFVEVAAEG